MKVPNPEVVMERARTRSVCRWRADVGRQEDLTQTQIFEPELSVMTRKISIVKPEGITDKKKVDAFDCSNHLFFISLRSAAQL